MRRFLFTSSIILTLILSVGIYAPSTHAQLIPATQLQSNFTPSAGTLPSDTSLPSIPSSSSLLRDNTSNLLTGGTSGTLTGSISAQLGQNTNTADPPTPPGFSGYTEILNGIMNWIMSLFAWLLGIAMVTLDSVVYYTVVVMGAYVKDLSAIGVTWSILRDIGNIALIFGFLAVGITTILNVDWYGGGTKFLPGLLIAAVFLNFSLFATEAVIDAGNLFATQFYTQINGGKPAGTKQLGGAVSTGSVSLSGVQTEEAISSKIMNTLKLQKLYGAARSNSVLFKGENVVYISAMGILLFIVTAFVMFSLAFILIARFIILIFLIILAPIGFAGLAIPMLSGQAKKWRDLLVEQTITAPILLLLLYVALRIITDSRFLSGTPDYLGFVPNADGTITKLPDLANALLTFSVAMGLLLAVTFSAKKLSAFGADRAMGISSRLSGATLLAAGASRMAGWAGRNTFGRAGRKLGIKSMANASFDFRNSSLSKSANQFSGLDLGKGQKGGYQATYDKNMKDQKQAALDQERRKVTEDAKAAQGRYVAAQIKYTDAVQEHEKWEAELAKLEEGEKNRSKFHTATSVEQQTELEAARKAVDASKTAREKRKTELNQAYEEYGVSSTIKHDTEMKISNMKSQEEINDLRSKVKDLAEKSEKDGKSEKVEKKEEKK